MTSSERDRRERIIQYRNASTVLHLKDGNGQAMAWTTLSVRQARHRFLFGCNVFWLDPKDPSTTQDAYRRQFTALLNFATLPFYWGDYEKTLGCPAEAKLQGMAAWCREHHITMNDSWK